MNEKYHVLLLPSWYPEKAGDIGGSFFREQAIALHKEGHKVGVIAPAIRSVRRLLGIFNKPYGLKFEDDSGVQTYRWHTVNFTPRLHHINKNRYLKIGEYLFKEYINKNGLPDILHVHSLVNAGFLAFTLSKKYNIPYVVTEHSSAFARGLVNHEVKHRLEKVVLDSSENIAVSNQFKNLLESQFDSKKAWKYIPNIVNNDFFEIDLLKKNDAKDFSFINVCLLDHIKRVDILIRSFSQVFKNNKKIKLKIGGDGPIRKDLEQLVKDEGIEDQVFFLGLLTREQVRQEMLKADAFVLSSEYETFGVVVIEALALGKPVIATRCGGPESIVVPSVGYLVEKNSVHEMASAMQHLYENNKYFNPSDIREYCRNSFSEKAVVKKIEKVYKNVLNDRPKHET